MAVPQPLNPVNTMAAKIQGIKRRDVRSWSASSAWARAEARELNDAMDRLVLNGDAASQETVALQTGAIRRMLVCVDGSDSGDQATGWAIGLAKLFRARVWVLTVLGHKSVFESYARKGGLKIPQRELMRLDQANGERILDATIRQLHKAHIPAEPLLVRGSAGKEIVRAIQRLSIDLVVLGSHGHAGRDRILLGSVADTVKNSAKAHILIAKGEYGPGPLLAPIDGSPQSRAAASFALRLARAWRARLDVLHAFHLPWLGFADWGLLEFQDIIRRFQMPTQPTGVHYVLSFGSQAKEILKQAQARNPALIVMGSRGLGAVGGLLLGSVSNRVSHESDASVLLVRDHGTRTK